jgi:selenium metabolism protein YedF
MDSVIVDARGELCPKPLIMAKKAINDEKIVNEFILLIDNETSKENVERFLKDNKVVFETVKKTDHFSILISKTGEKLSGRVDEYCDLPKEKRPSSDHVVCIKSDKMGIGDDDLGRILIKAFINTLKEVSPLPSKMVFYNSGVKLAVEDSPLSDSIRELQDSGVEIIICGTCADFFKIKEKIKTGTISNMYNILETLTSAGKIIVP